MSLQISRKIPGLISKLWKLCTGLFSKRRYPINLTQTGFKFSYKLFVINQEITQTYTKEVLRDFILMICVYNSTRFIR